MANEVREKRDLVLPPGTYAYMQDVTNGSLKTYTGPCVVNPTAQERPITYQPKSGLFDAVSLDDVTQRAPVAVEGYYIELLNPAEKDAQPIEGRPQPAPTLLVGRKVNVPGPAMFALWPGQAAKVIRGHHLRSNQYLLCRVYNEDEARANWGNAIVKLAETTPPTGTPGATSTPGEQAPTPAVTPPKAVVAAPPDLTVGKLFIIKGDEISFYIPPTGVTVVAEGGTYVREALTLERLEYAILVDENGRKRYEYGPQVVFPLPTEKFVEAKGDAPAKKFRAIELNEIQGLHIKIIAPYEAGGKKHNAGDEIFITGKEAAIYYPREEHAIVKYDGKTKHFATAVPAGEARYVMNRTSGEIRTVRGPAMLLPDPRKEVIVRRVLSDRQASLWYPGNAEALEYNRGLRDVLTRAPTTRTGAISEGDFERSLKGATKNARAASTSALYANAATMNYMEGSNVSREQSFVGDEISRGSTYNTPRSITLDTKYQGAPSLDIWTGYATMIVSKNGVRRVEQGPKTVLLDYDESLEVLTLSTGKPKTTDRLLSDVYLRVENNKVSDIIAVETADHVGVTVKLSYRVNFEGDSKQWFAVENYVKFLCDHVRSVLKGSVRRLPVEQFYADSTGIIRDLILGKSEEGKRSGMLFSENGMRILDVEVLEVTITDERIRGLLAQSQQEVVKSNIEVANLKRTLDVTKQKEDIARETAEVQAETKTRGLEIQAEIAAAEMTLTLKKIENTLKEIEERKKADTETAALEALRQDAGLTRDRKAADQKLALSKEEQDQKIAMLQAEAAAIVQRFEAVKGDFSNLALALSNNEVMKKMAESWSMMNLLGGDSVSDVLKQVFTGTPLAPVIAKMMAQEVSTIPGATKPNGGPPART